MGPMAAAADGGIDIGPHPHIGLQTVTWLVAGEAVHRDGLGTEQVIRPGQLNLMTAGHGIAHAEEPTGRYRGEVHGVQLWVAQPERTRHGAPAFEHHRTLPQLELANGVGTVLVGRLDGVVSPARRDSDHLGVDLALGRGETVVPLARHHEHALVVLEGEVAVGGEVVGPGRLAYLGPGRDELALVVATSARVLLLGGEPFDEPVTMWWNFVARTSAELEQARTDWNGRGERFAEVNSTLDRIVAPNTTIGHRRTG